MPTALAPPPPPAAAAPPAPGTAAPGTAAGAFVAPAPAAGLKPVAEPAPPDPPVRGREVVAATAAAVLFDGLVYRTGGFAAAGLFFLGMVAVFAAGSPFPRANWRGFWCVAGLLGVVAVRLAWLGWWGAALAGAALLAGLAVTRRGGRAWVMDLPVQWFQLLAAGPAALIAWRGLARGAGDGGGAGGPADRDRAAGGSPLAVALPAAAAVTFAGLFVLANPDLRDSVGTWLDRLLDRFGGSLAWLVPGPGQAFLWAAVFVAAAGALRPLVRTSLLDPLADREAALAADRRNAGPAASPAFAAVRNTLLAVVAVFAVYLPYELFTLWRRSFPEGFHYSGYAHEGAAWLTVALAAATALLGAMFRGSLLTDPRVGRLKRLAWAWSGLNFVLVAAVVNRLAIYVGFNGLSRMRVVGFLGVLAVALGFAAVVAKVRRDRGFSWLVRRQLRALALVVLAGVLLPTDWVAHAYNARRVVAGDPAPLALVGNHAIDAGGLLALEPVLDAENAVAAKGVAARIRLAAEDLPDPAGLATYQLAHASFRRLLARRSDRINALLAGTTPATAAADLAAYGLRWW